MPTVTGKVTTPDGTPVTGLPVLAWLADHPRRRATSHTGRDGTWRLDLPAGRWTVREQGHGAHEVTVAEQDIDLTAPTPAPEAPAPGEGGPSRGDMTALLTRRRAERET